MMQDRPPFPPELRERLLETGNAGILAGCSADEIIKLCKATAEKWRADSGKSDAPRE